LRERGFPKAKRHLEYQFEEALGRDLDETQPFAIQCKCWKTAPPITVIEKITLDEEYTIPIAILKRSAIGKMPLEVVVMSLDTFLDLIG
jgi:hypothetical protein